VNQLAELGQVERRADPGDARRKIVHITAAGRRQLRRLDQELDRAQERFVSPLDHDDRATYLRLLSTLLEHHSTAPAS
jgi:MarR family transcriptional regulator, lower aerobic nicotinate degradation pathway regulator